MRNSEVILRFLLLLNINEATSSTSGLIINYVVHHSKIIANFYKRFFVQRPMLLK
jgi:hypothetical protein